MRWLMSLYIEFVGSRHVQRISNPWITGICDERNAMDENAKGVMCWLNLSSTIGSSEYLRDPVTTIAQKRKGERSK